MLLSFYIIIIKLLCLEAAAARCIEISAFSWFFHRFLILISEKGVLYRKPHYCCRKLHAYSNSDIMRIIFSFFKWPVSRFSDLQSNYVCKNIPHMAISIFYFLICVSIKLLTIFLVLFFIQRNYYYLLKKNIDKM